MDFSWSKEQLEYKRAAIEFSRKELNKGLIERDQRGEFSRENWLKCAQFGILGLPFPKKYGGLDTDILTTMLTMEGLGYGCGDNGLIFGMNAQIWGVQMPIFKFGTDAQKEKYLPRFCRGEIIGAHGMTEPDSGSDAYSLRTRADAVGDGFVLNGVKTLVTNAPVADVVLVFATVNRAKGRWGVTAFLVETGTPGFSVSKHIDKMGLRTSPMGELIFTDCLLPAQNRLGQLGGASTIFNSCMEWERGCILGSYIGAMERQLETSIQYARQRYQFGQPIGSFQSVANRIVDMKVRLESARLLLYKMAWIKSLGKPALIEASMVKLYLSEVFVQSSLDAIKTHGGYGYATEFAVERDLRDAIGGMLSSGTPDIQRNIIARLLGLGEKKPLRTDKPTELPPTGDIAS